MLIIEDVVAADVGALEFGVSFCLFGGDRAALFLAPNVHALGLCNADNHVRVLLRAD